MRRTLAATVGGLVAAVGLVAPGIAQAAEPPSEVRVIPAPSYPVYPTDRIAFAGETGFLHQRAANRPWVWTTYADRQTTPITSLPNTFSATPAGGDTVVFLGGVPSHPATSTTQPALNLATNTWRDVPVSSNVQLTRLLGNSAAVAITSGTPPTAELRRIAADGSWTSAPITGVPAGTTGLTIVAGDDTGAVLRVVHPDGPRYGLVDVAAGRMALLPAGVLPANVTTLTKDRIGLFTSTSAQSLSRAAVLDGTATVPGTIEFLTTVPLGLARLAGDDVIVTPSTGATNKTVLRYSVGSSTPVQVVPRGEPVSAQAPDGVLFVGGTNIGDYAVRKATASDQSVVLPLVAPLVNAGVTLASGVVRHTVAMPLPSEKPEYRHFAEQIGPGEPTTGSPVADGALVNPTPCQTDAVCVRMIDGADTGSAYLDGITTGDFVTTAYLRSSPGGGATINTRSDAKLVDASPTHRLLSFANYQLAYRTDGSSIQLTGAPASALWFDTLWRANATGQIENWNLRADTPSAGPQPITTGSSCTKTEVQATGKHLYWTCGANGPAGVVEIDGGKRIDVPAGQYLLGDNFLVRHDANGALVRLDLTGGTLGEPATLATFARGELTDDRNITWAVDRFGGNVAWVDADNAVHIVDPGVTTSAPAAGSVSASSETDLPGNFLVIAKLTRPVTATRLTITQVRSDSVVARLSGGAARVDTTYQWNGQVNGKPAVQGTYRWSLAATADGREVTVANGTTYIDCGGTPTLHSYDCTGQPTILGLTSASTGQGRWLLTRVGGTVVANGPAEALSGLSGLVPFGDINGDNRNDLLIRRSDGSMRAYFGRDALPFSGAQSIAISGNWNAYDALIHTGDLNGDGFADLIARDRASGALFVFGGTAEGDLSGSVKIAGGYKGYSRFVGNGDINGDGKADLMMQLDSNSTMYALYGNGDGTFQSGLKIVGTGWLGYNTVIGAGDLNEDGKNDLVLRDTAGNLFRRLGTGQGTFGDRAQYGSGYQQYSGLY
ncbi:hypothetical protein Aab01nite_31590 [Paractinoplanes abujensis]|uniref:VCBS repeat protein n=1 Tax=Paractinoplanes abujensis TaxID=882441 RepID=A0A7W7D0C2_9ACTN|nr:VCBS repeat-containing protein [Actinoplanes abujensis]MBB4697948.1 hypothetical protein [Actinoplanes abujensis]GID19569.1 hypothetical protein Aab01nite_31590 [Actinoplanes abujensis]